MTSVLIIGGGVIGLSLARELRRKKCGKITILEKGLAGEESSFAAAGMLATQAETDKADAFFDFCRESRVLYPNLAAELLDETGVDIELDQNGTLYLAFDEKDSEELDHRYKWQSEAGLRIERLTAKETHKLEPFVSPDSIGSLFFPDDWQIENRSLLKALRKYAELNEIEILENTEVSELKFDGDMLKGIETSNEKIFEADVVILATGAWTSFIKGVGDLVPKVKPIRGHMLKFQTAKRLFSHVIYSPRGYIVPRKLGRILAGATIEDVGFDDSISEQEIEKVRENAIEISPNLSGLKVDEKWFGFRPFSSDGFPVLGNVSGVDNLFVATGHYRNGILLAPLTAKIMADSILSGTESKYLNEFGVSRFKQAKTCG